MIKLKKCKRFKCSNSFAPHRNRMFCSDYCCHRHISFVETMSTKVKIGMSISEIKLSLPNWSDELISHYYREARKKLSDVQVVLTLVMNDSDRILSENYLMNLTGLDKAPPSLTADQGQTIKEYNDSQVKGK